MSTPSTQPSRPLLRVLPFLLVVVTATQIGLSGCPSGGTAEQATGSQGQGSDDVASRKAPPAPTAHQLRGLDPSGQTVDVRFLAKLDPAQATEPSHYAASGGQAITDLQLLGDGRTVRLSFDALLLPGRDTLSVTGLVAVDGRRFPDAPTLSVSSGDHQPPTVQRAELEAVPGLDNDRLTVVFDDDMLTPEVLDPSHYSLQYPLGTPFALDASDFSWDAARRQLSIELHDANLRSFDLILGGWWSLAIDGLQDLGGNALATGYSVQATVTGDALPPTPLAVTQNSLVAVDGTVVDITADESLDMSNSLVASNFSFSNGATVIFADGMASTDMVRLTLDRAVTPGVDTATILGLTDPAGNRLATPVLLTIDSNDGTAPAVAGLTGESVPGWFNDTITVAFDERVHPSAAEDPANFSLESPPGTPVDLSHATFRYDALNWATTITLGGSPTWIEAPLDQARRLATLDGDGKGDRLGAAVAALGDVDGDGYDDVAVGSPRYDLPSANDAGAVEIRSGRDHSLIRRIEGPSKGAHFGEALATLGDLNGDGIDDLLVGAPQADVDGMNKAGGLFVHSGADGSLLMQVDGAWAGMKLGERVATAGDINHDLVPDLLTSMWKEDFGGKHAAGLIQVYSGADGSLLQQWGGENADDRAGEAIVGGFDFDGDQHDDILFGATRADTTLGHDAGVVRLMSGATGLELLRMEGAAAHDRFGRAAACLGDLDGDLVLDFAIGSPYADAGGLDKAGAVSLRSGATGLEIYRIDGFSAKDELGTALASGVDFDGDGYLDLLVGAPKVDDPIGDDDGDDDDDGPDDDQDQGQGAIYLHSGLDGSLLRSYHNPTSADGYGKVFSWGGDLDHDGHGDILIGLEKAKVDGNNKTGQLFLEAARADLPYQSVAGQTELAFGAPFTLTVSGQRDLAGNLMANAIAESAILGGDAQPPLLTSAVQNLWANATGATVDLMFNEGIDLDQSNGWTVQASNPAATLVAWTSRAQGTLLRLQFDMPLTVGSTTFQLSGLKDAAGNLIQPLTETLAAAPLTTPTLIGSTAILAGSPATLQLQAAFQEPVLPWSAMDPTHWSLSVQGVPLPLDGATFHYDPVDRILDMEVPAPATLQVGEGFQLTATGLQDPFGQEGTLQQQTGTVSAD